MTTIIVAGSGASGRVWVPANHCPENAGDSAEAARGYLGGLFPARYAHLTEAFLANAPPWRDSSRRGLRTGSPPARLTRIIIQNGRERLPAAGVSTWCSPP